MSPSDGPSANGLNFYDNNSIVHIYYIEHTLFNIVLYTLQDFGPFVKYYITIFVAYIDKSAVVSDEI